MLSSTFLPQLRPSVLSLSFLERRSWIARSLFNLLASQRQTTRLRLLQAEERVNLAVRVDAADNLVVDADVPVDVEDAVTML